MYMNELGIPYPTLKKPIYKHHTIKTFYVKKITKLIVTS